MHILLELFLTFLKIGAVSFGGGYGMIPLLTEEVVSRGWLTATEMLNYIAVSESTPGPIAVNMATFVGASQGGILGPFGAFLGAFLATLGVVLPAFIIILVIASIVKGLLKFAGVEAFLKGVRPVVIGLITATGISLFLTVIFSLENLSSTISFDFKALIIFSIVCLTHFIYKKIKKKAFHLYYLY